jgi:hypothetical protein
MKTLTVRLPEVAVAEIESRVAATQALEIRGQEIGGII